MENKNSYLDLAQIPYIEHEYRMFKAYEKISKLKIALGISNAIWVVVAIMLLVR